TNLYPNSRQEPKPTAPSKDLPAPAAARFKRLREGLLKLPGVVEHIKFMGSWAWTWEYAVGHRKLCWLHVMQSGPSITFTIADQEEPKALAVPRLPSANASAIRNAQRTGPVRWCALEVGDQKAADAFLSFVRRKLAWVVADTPGAGGRRSLVS
ncbi:MAG TPA: hypothetical protein VG817_09600, partial [Gemmatimonadales bacterium]|nr:hypothetical protein [Gemmatimonadales bacterium]